MNREEFVNKLKKEAEYLNLIADGFLKFNHPTKLHETTRRLDRVARNLLGYATSSIALVKKTGHVVKLNKPRTGCLEPFPKVAQQYRTKYKYSERKGKILFPTGTLGVITCVSVTKADLKYRITIPNPVGKQHTTINVRSGDVSFTVTEKEKELVRPIYNELLLRRTKDNFEAIKKVGLHEKYDVPIKDPKQSYSRRGHVMRVTGGSPNNPRWNNLLGGI